MNVLDGLQRIRDRLIDNDADPATVAAVDQIMQRASLPSAAPAAATSLLQLVRLLMRTPAANNNTSVYNDLTRLEQELGDAATALREAQAREEAKPIPKTKKYYKQLKERDRKSG